MKRKTVIMVGLCCLLSTLLVAGCGKKKVNPDEQTDSRKPEGHLLESSGSDGSDGYSETEGNYGEGGLESLDKTGTPLALDNTSDEYKRTYGRSTAPLLPVFFAFDSSSINATQFDNLNADGRYLLDHNSPKLVIEGNCDERGTNEYNLALGELRAMNVKKYLVNLGVESGKISTISYGSQRPLFPGSDEKAWAGNRRADLVLQ